MLKFLDTAIRKVIVFGLLAVFPIVELLFGAPLIYAVEPLPITQVVSPELLSLLTAVSIVTSISSIIAGVAFWLEKRTNKKIEEGNATTMKKICDVEAKIDSIKEHIVELFKNNDDSNKAIYGEKFRSVQNQQDYQDKRLDNLEDKYYRQGVRGRSGDR